MVLTIENHDQGNFSKKALPLPIFEGVTYIIRAIYETSDIKKKKRIQTDYQTGRIKVRDFRHASILRSCELHHHAAQVLRGRIRHLIF